MVGTVENGNRRRGNRWRIAAWTVAALLLLLPWVAMQFTDEVDWDAFDFAFAAVLIVGAGLMVELTVRVRHDLAYRAAVCLALAAVVILIWVNAAVGIIGSENDPANGLFGGVIAVGVTGAILARFRPQGMARALFATACAQALVAVVALIAGLGATGPDWPLDLLLLTGFFVALFSGSAWLFRQAARG